MLESSGTTQTALADRMLESGAESGPRGSLRARIARALNPDQTGAAADALRASMLAELSHVRAAGPYYLLSPAD